MDNQSISYGVAGIMISVAIFAAFKAGQIYGLRSVTFDEQIHQLDLERVKVKITFLLKKLWEDTKGNNQLPGKLDFEVALDKYLLTEDFLIENILTLDHIYYDLVSNGANSVFFVHILREYGQNVM